ncbi:MAG TPA: hypothetical protein VFB59_05260, partial [Candidatus Saccharimonadales bacterium]|nr:hypothetical protein [Candidatus Saccharimonadales bacterium]
RILLWFNDATPVYVDTSWLEQKYAAYGDAFDLSKVTPSASVQAAPFGVGVAGSTSAEWTKNKDKGRAIVIIASRVLTRLQAIGKLRTHVGVLAVDKIDASTKRKILTSLFSQTFQNDPDDQWTDEWLERNVARQKLATKSVGDSMLISENFVLDEDKKNKEYILSYAIPKIDGIKGDGLIVVGRLPMQKVGESQRHMFKNGNHKLTVLGEVSDVKYKKRSAGGASEVTLHVELVMLGLIDSAYTEGSLPEPKGQ